MRFVYLIGGNFHRAEDASQKFSELLSRPTTNTRYPSTHANMSLSIPNAPNSGLFKQGYQKYVLQSLICLRFSSAYNKLATTPKMEPCFAISTPAVPSPKPYRLLSDPMVATRLS